jgi:RHS repeat-associated protein
MNRACSFFMLSFEIAASAARRFLANFRRAAALSIILAISIGPVAHAQTETANQPPTFSLEIGAPVSIEEADASLRAQMPESASQPVGQGAVAGASALSGLSAAQTCPGGSSSQPVEIVTLAASLKCDVDLIFEYVYNNIEYEPLFGSNKGPLGTLLDLRGSDSDQAQLFAALLTAAGYSSSQFSFQYGNVRLNGAQASGWLGVKNDGNAISKLIANGGIPQQNLSVNGDGTLNRIDVAHVWVQVQINGTNYVFDPSFKLHTVTTGLSDLGAVLGYTQSAFLSAAGGSTDSTSIWNINRSNVRANLTTYANNLIGYINNYNKTNSAALTTQDIVGGKIIQYLTGSPLRLTALPTLSPSQPAGWPQNWGSSVPDAYRTCFTISMPGVTQTPCGSASSQTIKLFSDQTYGHRITISSVPSGANYVPTLLIDGAAPPNGQNTGTALSSGSWTVKVCILHPYTSPNVNVCGDLSIKVGGFFLVGAGWGQVGRGMVEKHRRLLTQAQAAGTSPTSEVMLGESLAVINYTWLAEVAAAQQLGDAIGKITSQYHHGVGITGQAQIQNTNSQGPYVDLPLNSFSLQPQTNFSGSGLPPAIFGPFFTAGGVGSSLESAVLEQTQAAVAGIQAASTVRLVDLNAATAARTYFVEGTASGLADYFAPTTGIRANLVIGGYQPNDLSLIDCQVSSNCSASGTTTGKQLLLPASGNIGINQWHGAGYSVITQTSSSIRITQKISGGLSGGYTADPVSPEQLSQSSAAQMSPAPANADVSSASFANISSVVSQFISDPVDAVTGAYAYQRTDLTTGGGAFPYALSFGRSYSSARNLVPSTLGTGWAHSLNISASRSSDPFAGFGESSSISAAAAIAANYVSQDLLSGTKTAQIVTVAWMVNRWLTDQLTNNSVAITWPNTSEQFILLPHIDGSATATYAAPLGSAVVLTGSAPDTYGNFTTFSYLNKDQSLLTFNSVASAASGGIADWTSPNGTNVAFAYNYTFNGTNYLSSVTNNLGRSLTLSYSGAQVSGVTDDTGRAVSYGYDANNNLTSSVDPLHFGTTYAYDGANRLTQIFYPANPGTAFFTNVYDALGRVNLQADAYNNWSTFYLAGSRTEFIDAAGDRHVTYQTPRGRIIKDVYALTNGVGNIFNDTPQQDGIVNVTTNQYDGMDRLTKVTAPGTGSTSYAYDPNGNVLSITAIPKPGSPLASLVTTYSYDPVFNKPVSVTDPLGLVASMSYDGGGNLIGSVSDVGSSPHFNARSNFTYNSLGKVVSTTDPLGTVTQFSYDGFGNTTETIRDAGDGLLNQKTSFGYNEQGDVVKITDPRGNVTRSTYDAARQPVSATASSGLVSTNIYDPNGQIVQTQQSINGAVLRSTAATYTLTGKTATATDANGNTTRYSYDLLDRVASVKDAMGRVASYGYDALSRKVAVSNPAIQGSPLLQQSYTPDGLLASLTDANNHVTSFAYDRFNRLATTTYPLGSAETLTYDADNNVLTRKTRANQTISFAYDTLNRLKTQTPPSPAPVVSYSYDLAGRLTGISDSSAAIAAAEPPSGTSVQYTTSLGYDAMNRPTAVTWSPAPSAAAPTAGSVTFGHAYNKVNQRIGQGVTDNTWFNYPAASPSTVSYTANALNQYTAVGAVTPTYDGNGNLTSDGTFTFGYDSENRLISASGAGNTASYTFDAQGRRKTKTVNGTTTVFVTDADNREVLEYDGASGAILRWYAYGLGPNDVLGQMSVVAVTRATLVPDMLGSVIGSLDSNSGALSKIGYLPYGKSATASGPFDYTGQRIDPETGGLYYYRARHYSSALGRFMQPDPIGTRGGINFYAYVGNDPLNFNDPNGLLKDGIASAGRDFYELSIAKPASDIARYASDAVNDPAYFMNAIGPTLAGLGMNTPTTKVGSVGLSERATEIHKVLDPIAFEMRTTAVLETDIGRIIAGGARDLTPAQRALVGPGEIAARAPGVHAEITALDKAANIGATPSQLAVTRDICPVCASVIESLGGRLTSPKTAVFPRR